MFFYHLTVTSSLQNVARLTRSSPYVATLQVPVEKAIAVAEKQAGRYPTITADHVTRTHLRKAKLPVVQMVIMLPKDGMVTIYLISNQPAEKRETWEHVFDEDTPLIWRNYQLKRGKNDAVTWGLSEQAKGHYRERIARLITGRGGPVKDRKKPYQFPDETAADQVLLLAQHLQGYPGLSGIRTDVFDLAQYSTKVWKSTRPHHPYPEWPTMPYTRFKKAILAPLSRIMENHNAKKTDQKTSQ